MLALVLALIAPPAGSVELAGERLRALREPAIEAAAPAPWVERRELVLVPVAGGVQIRGRWWIRALGTGWFSGRLFFLEETAGLRVVSARWGARPAALQVDDVGGTIAGQVTGSVEVRVEAFVPGDPARAALLLKVLPAVRGTIEVAAPEGLRAELRADGSPVLAIAGRHWSGAGDLELSFAAASTPAADRPPVVVAKVGIGVTVGDAELRGRARAVWEVRQGEVTGVALDTAGLGADLEVVGANVRGFVREGGRVRVELQAPVRDRVEVELRWSAPIGKAAQSRAELPTITPTEVFHSEVALQLARDGEVEAVPEAPGWSPVAAATLPAWAQGLVEGTATASLVAGGSGSPSGGSLSLLRFVPLEGPPVVIDVAAYTVATSREGRALVRAHYEVRNERAAQLRLTPPAGFRVIGVRVGGKTATPARARDGSWIVPLLRSVETVQGLLSFPVEVILLGESTAWHRREARKLALPRLDAPIAVSRLTLHLPPGYRSRKQPGDGEVVASFTRGEGITYGLGVGEVGAAEADAVFQEAVGAWMRNDFGAAQQQLDALRAMGASNENIARLQSNLDVVEGKSDVSGDMSLQRRVREQARARAYADVQAQAELKQKAEEERARGEYAASASSYEQALAVGDKLARLEQEESVEQKSTNSRLAAEFKVVQSKSATTKLGRRRDAKKKLKAEGVTVYDFADEEISAPRVDRDSDGAGDDGEPQAPDEGAPVEDTAAAPTSPTPSVVTSGYAAGEESQAGASGPELPQPSPNLNAERVRDVRPTSAKVVVRQTLDSRVSLRKRRATRAVDKERGAPASQSHELKDSRDFGMPTPVVHASALSVVVPAVGEAVRYQRLLLPAGAAYAVEISAKEPLFAKE